MWGYWQAFVQLTNIATYFDFGEFSITLQAILLLTDRKRTAQARSVFWPAPRSTWWLLIMSLRAGSNLRIVYRSAFTTIARDRLHERWFQQHNSVVGAFAVSITLWLLKHSNQRLLRYVICSMAIKSLYNAIPFSKYHAYHVYSIFCCSNYLG